MNLDEERKVFENHLKKMGKTDNETFSKNEDDSYQMDIIHFGWKIWQAAIARMEVRINTLDEILLNQGEALAQAKAQAVQEWISVQDRMPEQGQKVLVFRPDAHNHPHKDPNFKICTYAGADIFINSHFEHVITHWKPLESPIEAQEPADD